MTIYTVDFPINSMVDLSIAMLDITRWYMIKGPHDEIVIISALLRDHTEALELCWTDTVRVGLRLFGVDDIGTEECTLLYKCIVYKCTPYQNSSKYTVSKSWHYESQWITVIIDDHWLFSWVTSLPKPTNKWSMSPGFP